MTQPIDDGEYLVRSGNAIEGRAEPKLETEEDWSDVAKLQARVRFLEAAVRSYELAQHENNKRDHIESGGW